MMLKDKMKNKETCVRRGGEGLNEVILIYISFGSSSLFSMMLC